MYGTVTGAPLPTAVDLSDIVAFAQIIAGGYDESADFNNDSVIDLSDIGRFVPAIGADCTP